MMGWTPTIDSWIGIAGLAFSAVGLFVSGLSLREASLAKKAANNAETAANNAKNAVRREDHKSQLLTKLTTLRADADSIHKTPRKLQARNFVTHRLEIRRALIECANLGHRHFPRIHDRLKEAATTLDDFSQQASSDSNDEIESRGNLAIGIGNIISDVLSELQVGVNYDVE
jgi:uncharacterized membrane protein YgaE (UPF0421/DUF939 family)